MKAAQYGHRYDTSERLNGSPEGSVLAECQVRAHPVIVGGISCEDPAQMRLAEYHDMVEALTLDRTDQLNLCALKRAAIEIAPDKRVGGHSPDVRITPLRLQRFRRPI
jgi:hypothetical protein